MTRDECEHGQLRRSCEICELRAEAEEQSRLIERQAEKIAALREDRDSHQREACRAMAELDALCQRIESAPVGEIICGRANRFGGYHVEIAHDVSWVKGKRVRLVVETDDNG